LLLEIMVRLASKRHRSVDLRDDGQPWPEKGDRIGTGSEPGLIQKPGSRASRGYEITFSPRFSASRAEHDDDWAVTDRRYVTFEAMARIYEPAGGEPREVLAAVT
jgi:hypothetical protein